jgi:hypothetical protein
MLYASPASFLAHYFLPSHHENDHSSYSRRMLHAGGLRAARFAKGSG